ADPWTTAPQHILREFFTRLSCRQVLRAWREIHFLIVVPRNPSGFGLNLMHAHSDFDPDDSSVRYHPEIWFVPLVDRKRRPKETLCFRSKKEAGQYPSLPFAFRATARVWRSDPIGTVHGGNNLVPIRAVQKLRESGWRP